MPTEETADVVIRFLPPDERWKLAADYAEIGDPVPNGDASVLVLEKDGEIVAHMAFHKLLALGVTYIAPEYRSAGGTAVKLLSHAADQLFQPGDALFIPVPNHESPALVEQAGARRVGSLYRKDY